MRNETEIINDGMNILIERLGVLEAEFFIHKIHRDIFNYTEWQRKLWENKSPEQICGEAVEYRKYIGK